MINRAIFWGILIGATATIPQIQLVANAKTAVEINAVAQSITVMISDPKSQGSGVIIQRQGDIYTVLTAAHVLKKQNVSYQISTSDGQKYKIIDGSVRRPNVNVDLAVVKFRASANYPVAKLGNSNNLTGGMDLYVAGYPAPTAAINETVFVFRTGTVSANSNKVFEKGYSLIYSNDTLPGMSGGGVLNQDGELVAIHGRGDREQSSNGELGAKTGFNLGIPINRFGMIASNLGVNLEQKLAVIPQNITLKADDYLALAVQQFDKGDYRGVLVNLNRATGTNPDFALVYSYRGMVKDKLSDTQGALTDYNLAIKLDPNNAISYGNRGQLKSKMNDAQGALADYNRAIEINPSYAFIYYGRAMIKDRFSDTWGAVADMNIAIKLDHNIANAYFYRGALKEKLNDIQGALVDINLAIKIEPNNASLIVYRGSIKEKSSDISGALLDYNLAIKLNPNGSFAYTNRGILKQQKLNDIPGSIVDLKQAAILLKQENNLEAYQGIIKIIKLLEASD